MINTYIPFLNKKEKDMIINCIDSNYVSTIGPNVFKFENLFKKIFNFKYCIALNSGTSAIHLSLLSHDIGFDDLVIVPSYTFAATVNAITYTGAEPWFFDCNNNYFLDANKLDESLERKTLKKNGFLIEKKTKKKVKAIIIVQTFGAYIPFNEFYKIGIKYNINIIFDSAAAHDPNIFIGLNKKNSIFCFSFNGNKTITTGSGGILATNSKKLAKKVKILSNVGKDKSNYDHKMIGYNYKMSNLQASIGIAQLENLNKILFKKKNLFNNYYKKLLDCKFFKKIFCKKYINWTFCLEVKNRKTFNDIKILFNKNNIQMNLFWKPLHLQKPYKHYIKDNLDYSNKTWYKILVLPSHPGLTKIHQIKIIKIINNYFKNKE